MYKLTLIIGLFGSLLISFVASTQSSFRRSVLQDELPAFNWVESTGDNRILAAISSFGYRENGEYDTNDYSGRMLTTSQSQEELKINIYNRASGEGKENGEYDDVSGYNRILSSETGEGY